MKKYNIILFDLDGTISDSSGGITSCVQYALEFYGIKENNMDILRTFIGPPLAYSFKKNYGLSDEQIKEATVKYRERYEPEGVYDNELYPGIEELLIKLKKAGKTVCVATSKPEDTAETVLKYFDIYDYFDYVVGADRKGQRQSKEQVIEELFKRAGINEENKSEVVMVGDTRYDIIGAGKMGVDSIGVGYGFGDVDEMRSLGATYIVDTVSELDSFLGNV